MASQSQTRVQSLAGGAIRFVRGLIVEALVTGVLWLILSRTGMSPALQALLSQDAKAAWHMTRAVGTVAYVLLTGAVAWGLILSSRIAKDLTPAPVTLEMHSSLSWIALGLGAYHGFLFLLDGYYHFTVASLLVPFTAPYRPLPTGLGTLGLYLMLLTSISFSWRSWIGQRGWRLLHLLTLPAYALVTLHGLLSGTDSAAPGMRLLYGGSVLLVLFLVNYRLLAGRKQGRAARAAAPIAARGEAGAARPRDI